MACFASYYKISKHLGKGGFGTVYRCESRNSGTMYAVKILTVSPLRYTRDRCTARRYPNEVYLWKDLKHDNIIRFIDYFSEHKSWFFVMEYKASFVDLHHILTEQRKLFCEVTVATITSQLVSAASYLRSKSITHRDLKPENILYERSTKRIKIIDFGCATTFTSLNEPLTQMIGTPMYYPPEFHKSYKTLPDSLTIWSIGTITYILLNGKFPFPELLSGLQRRKLKMIKSGISDFGKMFIKRCLRFNPVKRYTYQQMISSTWLSFSIFV